MAKTYKLNSIYVIIIDGSPTSEGYTALTGACDACGISYGVASKREESEMRFVVDGKFVQIKKVEIVRQKKGGNFK